MQTAVLLAMMALVLPLAVPAAATAPSTSPRDMDLLHVSLSDLQAGSPEVMEAIRSAVTNVGVFAVVGSSSPGVQEAALREYAKCVSGAAMELGHDSQTVFTPTPASTPLASRPVTKSPPFTAVVIYICHKCSSDIRHRVFTSCVFAGCCIRADKLFSLGQGHFCRIHN